MRKIKKFIKNRPKIYFLLYKIYLPIKKLKNKKSYDRHYMICFNNLKNVKNQKKIIYVGIPIHNNLGDLAQYYCIKKWLNVNYSQYEIVEFPDNIICHNHNNIIKKMQNLISPNDFFVFQSGYRTTDVANFEGEYAHQKILKNFKNRIIVFPQTVNFSYDREIIKSQNAYNQNDNYLFLARDNISYLSSVKMYNEDRVLLYPDIVTSLIGNCNIVNLDNKRNGILFCLRNDDEKFYSDEEYEKLIEQLKNITDIIDTTDTNSPLDFEFDKSNVENEISKKLNQFSKYKLIITDRYHGTIFSLVSNTPVIVLNSTDHKLSSGVNWFKGIYDNFVYYCDNLNNVYELADMIYKSKHTERISSYFNEKYYLKLKNEFDKRVR